MSDVLPPVPPIDIGIDDWRIVHRLLQRHVPGHAVWAFGSRARGQARPFSDLDLALLGPEPLSPETSATLADELSESDLPWKVDLVDLARTSDAFRRIIDRDKVILQRAGAATSGDPDA
jgi:type I restriction enzyme S subunit